MPQSSPEGLFRYMVLSQVLSRVFSGERMTDAVQRVAVLDHVSLAGERRRVSTRTLYRWLKAFKDQGTPGLEPQGRMIMRADPPALPDEDKLLDFIAKEKEDDPEDSIPELIRRARARGIIAHDTSVDRSTVYRKLRRRGASVKRRRTAKQRDSRRFAHPHRMEMVLSDGKHFRAGAARAKRVALFFLDDSSRYALHVVVGPSESAKLFLRGLYEAICLHGLMSILYLDHGPGFIADDTVTVVRNLKSLLIHGEVKYPEGHGKIERFNRTANADIIRGLDGRPDVDPHCGALELRLQHYIGVIYNHRPHESLRGLTPAERFSSDQRALQFPQSDVELKRGFVVFEKRRVSRDHVVSVNAVDYEVPRGHAGECVILHRNVLDDTLHFPEQDGRLVQLHEVDLAANAKSRRASGSVSQDATPRPLKKSSADLAFDTDFRPVILDDGGFIDPDPSNGDFP